MKVSVCMATFNGEMFIQQQLVSILSQISENDEVVISDDSSNDTTEEIVKNINDPRVRFLYNKYERGYTKNFENALKHCTGDIIFLADQDDVWLPGKVESMTLALKNFDFVVSDCRIADSQLNVTHPSHFALHSVKRGFINNLLLPRYIGACMAFNRKVLDYALPFPRKQKYAAHDYWISLISEMCFKVEIINEPLIMYRRHDSNASNGGTKSKNSLYHKLSVRIYTGIFLIQRWLVKH
ncbi:glycosyltransferase family 2 protein [Shewanella baltica]|uniref:glycosyltransferase family 2 protein n=1 Tax=Shewanella baltica TaxID=62322 RepID=UPI00217EF76E|nr:glycosyltransferase family 2 protein [Shewanella baltica]MCS6209210.1 glycosyltransferase family 2 protein [Shewanella baltica]